MNILQWIIAVGGAVSAVAAVVQFAVRPVVRWGSRIESAVSFVEMNMTNNGGSTLRDAVDRIESRLTALEKKQRSSTVPKKSATKKP